MSTSPHCEKYQRTSATFFMPWRKGAAGETAHTKDIAQRLNTTTSALSTRRHALLESGIITAPKRGELEFTLPHLKEYLLHTN